MNKQMQTESRRVVLVGSTGPLSSLLNECLFLNGIRTKTVGRSSSNSDVLVGNDYLVPEQLLRAEDAVIFLAWPTSTRKRSTQTKFVQTTSEWARHSESVSARFIFISTTQASRGARSRYGRAKYLAEQEVLKFGGLVLRVGLLVDDSIECLATRIRSSPFARWLPDGIRKVPIELTSSRDITEAVLYLLGSSITTGQRFQCASTKVSVKSLIEGVARDTPPGTGLLNLITPFLDRLPSVFRDHPLIDGLIGLGDRDSSHAEELTEFQNLSTRGWNEFCWNLRATRRS